MPPVCAARWIKIWPPLHARRAFSSSRRSQSRLRGTTMSAGSTPRVWTRWSTTKDPMKPAPPVTRIFLPLKNCVTPDGLPVDPRGPPFAVLGVPLDRLANAFFPRVFGRPPGELVELAEIDAGILDLALAEARPPFRVGLELLGAPVPQLLAGPDDELVPVEDRDRRPVAVHVDVAGGAVERGADVAAHPVLDEAEVAPRPHVPQGDHVARQRLGDDGRRDEPRALARPVVVEHPRHDRRHPVGGGIVAGEEGGRELRGRVDALGVHRRPRS